MEFGVGKFTLNKIKEDANSGLNHYRLYDRLNDTNLTIAANNYNEAVEIAAEHEYMLDITLKDEVIIEECEYKDTRYDVNIPYIDTNGRYDNYIIARLYKGMKENEYPDIDSWVNDLTRCNNLRYYPLTWNKSIVIEDKEIARLYKIYNRKMKINKINEIIIINNQLKNN
ncbi:hypothetical protein [Carboxylicivirga sp. RSCT41]|uniref:hypothetical protein n=1 Tax=Carboxylicivirga agarovorans TaxID=3417570 RepID=UPI003D34BF87